MFYEEDILYDVYFGTAPGALVLVSAAQSAPTWDPPGDLVDLTEYFWRIDLWLYGGLWTGQVWSFTTLLRPPEKAVNPNPADDSEDAEIDTALTWENGGRAATYDVYFGDAPGSLVLVSAAQAGTSWTPADDLEYDTDYWWRIDSTNASGTTAGDLWTFRAQTEPVLAAFAPFTVALPIAEQLQWNTGILCSADGSEQRIARLKPPRQGFTLPIVCRTAEELEELQALMHLWLKGQWLIPIWPESAWHPQPLSLGATSLLFDTRYADYRADSLAVVYSSPDCAEFVAVDAVANEGLTLSAGLTLAYPGGQWIMPCRRGYAVSAAKARRFDDGSAIVEVAFDATDNIDITGWTADQTCDGYDVLTDPAWFEGAGFETEHDPDVVMVDAKTGRFKAVSTSDFNVVTQPHAFLNETKEKAWRFRQWLHGVVGRQKTFLVPTFKCDFVLTRACGSADTTIYVANRHRAAYMGFNAMRTYVGFRHAGSDTIVPVKITGLSAPSAEEEQIDLLAAPGESFAPGDTLCWLDRCRLANDIVTLDWYERGQNRCSTQLVRVSQ